MQRQIMSRAGLAIVMAVALAAGCTTTDPYTGEQKTSRATKGAGIGALAGAAVGAATASDEDRTKGALTGAAAGAAIGGGIGHYQDRQEAKLRQSLEATGVRVERVGDTVRLIMPGNVTFDTDSSRINPGFKDVLNSVVTVVREFDQTLVRINGYTDSTGSFEHNQKLSEERANSVARYFLNAGIKPGRIRAQGLGERNPIATNDTAAGRAKNRRVEIDLAPMQ